MYSAGEDVQRWVLPLVLEEQARTRPDQAFVSVVDGDSLTYGALHDQAAQVAGLLQQLGVQAGDRVAIMLPNGLDIVRAWAGVGRLGAVAVMINTELVGSFLAHPLNDAQPRLLIVHADYLDRLEALGASPPSVEHLLVVGAMDRTSSAYRPFEAWRSATATKAPYPAAQDAACIMYTSGTTGAPKGVIMPHAHCYLFGLGVVENLGVTVEDHYYIALPLFHANGLLMQLCGTMIAGARATVRDRFSASAWLGDVRRTGATLTHSLGAISAFILAQPPSTHDRDHRLRLILSAPNFADHERIWRERFGIGQVVGAYGMTEVNIPLYGERTTARPGACGRPYARRFEVEIRDPDTDLPVPLGEVGEIMVRPRVANGFMAGYFNLPEKTVEAWRNFWFHTGDAGRMDADGYVTFVDRIKDCIRRRGENISAADIEASFMDLPGVAEIAAFAVASGIDGGEDEIMMAIVAAPDAIITAAMIAARAKTRMPRFAMPRYVEFKTSLPKTGTEKVRKADLKQAGVTPDTIDLSDFYR
jgi:crotonobetaine/carnitine-CoA ligase